MRNSDQMSSWAIVLSTVFAVLTAPCNATSAVAQSVEAKQIASGHKEGISTIIFSPDARLVVSGGNDNTVKLWDVQTGQLEQMFEGHTRAISSLDFSPDGLILASGSFDQTIKLWDVSSRKLLLMLKTTGQVKDMSFSPDGKILASSGGDGVRLWDVGAGKLLRFLPSNRGVLTVTFSPDGKLLADAGGGGIRLWDVKEGKLLRHLQGTEPELIISVAFSPNCQVLASGGNRRMIRFWDVSTGNLKSTIDVKGDFIRAIAFSSDGRILAAADRTSAQLWNIENRQVQEVLSNDVLLLSIALSPRGAIWAGGDTSGTLRLWRFRSQVAACDVPRKCLSSDEASA